MSKASTNSAISTVYTSLLVGLFIEALCNFFRNEGGALAVENALKTAIDWKVRKNFLKGNKEEKIVGDIIEGKENLFVATKVWATHFRYDSVLHHNGNRGGNFCRSLFPTWNRVWFKRKIK